MTKTGCGQSGYETLKLNISQEWTVGLNWFSYMILHIQES